MKEAIVFLIKAYKAKISTLQARSKIYEEKGNGGACITINGEIQAYNAVIGDLEKIIKLNT